MKKTFLCAVLATMMMTGCGTGNSTIDQLGSAVLNDIVAKGSNSATSSSTTTTTVGNILQSVLGTSTMTQQNLIGTWTYSQPGCAFTSEKLLAHTRMPMVMKQIAFSVQMLLSETPAPLLAILEKVSTTWL